MSRQYNMYNVQLSEFWKQRVGREHMHNVSGGRSTPPLPSGAGGKRCAFAEHRLGYR